MQYHQSLLNNTLLQRRMWDETTGRKKCSLRIVVALELQQLFCNGQKIVAMASDCKNYMVSNLLVAHDQHVIYSVIMQYLVTNQIRFYMIVDEELRVMKLVSLSLWPLWTFLFVLCLKFCKKVRYSSVAYQKPCSNLKGVTQQ